MLRGAYPKSPGMRVDHAAARLNNAYSSISSSMLKFDHHLDHNRRCVFCGVRHHEAK
jgi:hypothetical protein